MNQSSSKARIATTVVTIVVIIGLVVLIEYLQKKPMTASTAINSSSSSVPSGSSSSNSGAGSTATTNSAYKDGTYTASSEYYVPHGYEDIKVTLTIANNTITDASVQNSENDPESAQYQEEFAREYKSYVVGKKVGAVNVSYIAGASDTTEGFNEALDHIKTQAQA